MFEIGKARKSFPIRLAACCWLARTSALPVGRFTPAVRMTKSFPSTRLPRTCVSVKPLISLVEAVVPVCSTRDRAYDVPTSKLRRCETGTTTKTGNENSLIVVFADDSILYE
jgi:hypothetical protein